MGGCGWVEGGGGEGRREGGRGGGGEGKRGEREEGGDGVLLEGPVWADAIFRVLPLLLPLSLPLRSPLHLFLPPFLQTCTPLLIVSIRATALVPLVLPPLLLGVAAPCCDAPNASQTLRVDPPSGPVQLSSELNSSFSTARPGGVRTKRLSCTTATRSAVLTDDVSPAPGCWNILAVSPHFAPTATGLLVEVRPGVQVQVQVQFQVLVQVPGLVQFPSLVFFVGVRARLRPPQAFRDP